MLSCIEQVCSWRHPLQLSSLLTWVLNTLIEENIAVNVNFSTALAPFEAARVKIQTTPGFANTLRQAAPKMFVEEGINAFYKGLAPLWMRQIPYTMMKFACFERTVELLYRYVVSSVDDSEEIICVFLQPSCSEASV